jgi:threonine aldolase
MAGRLAREISNIRGAVLFHPVQANGVFVQLPPKAIESLRKKHFFYIFDERNHVARFMCSFNTPESEVQRLAEDIRLALESV